MIDLKCTIFEHIIRIYVCGEAVLGTVDDKKICGIIGKIGNI